MAAVHTMFADTLLPFSKALNAMRKAKPMTMEMAMTILICTFLQCLVKKLQTAEKSRGQLRFRRFFVGIDRGDEIYNFQILVGSFRAKTWRNLARTSRKLNNGCA